MKAILGVILMFYAFSVHAEIAGFWTGVMTEFDCSSIEKGSKFSRVAVETRTLAGDPSIFLGKWFDSKGEHYAHFTVTVINDHSYFDQNNELNKEISVIGKSPAGNQMEINVHTNSRTSSSKMFVNGEEVPFQTLTCEAVTAT